jgi:hypothetical protein
VSDIRVAGAEDIHEEAEEDARTVLACSAMDEDRVVRLVGEQFESFGEAFATDFEVVEIARGAGAEAMEAVQLGDEVIHALGLREDRERGDEAPEGMTALDMGQLVGVAKVQDGANSGGFREPGAVAGGHEFERTGAVDRLAADVAAAGERVRAKFAEVVDAFEVVGFSHGGYGSARR